MSFEKENERTTSKIFLCLELVVQNISEFPVILSHALRYQKVLNSRIQSVNLD